MTDSTDFDATVVYLDTILMVGDAERTQLREGLDDDTIDRYAQAMEDGDKFPLVDLVEAGDGTFFISDGWHRVSAREVMGKTTVRAVVHSVPEGVNPLDEAVRMALQSNAKHGLQLTKGDLRRKAKAALLLPEFRDWSMRALGAEIKVSAATICRARADLIREGLLDHPVMDGPMPIWMPSKHASVFVLGSEFADENEMDQVYSYIRRLAPQGDPEAWEWDQERQEVSHDGLIVGKCLTFGVDDNPIVDGLPTHRRELQTQLEDDDMRGSNWGDLSQDDRDRIEAAQARRSLRDTAKRLKSLGDRELTRAVNTLLKRANQPDLWPDIACLVWAGGPAEEHRHEEEMF